MSLARDQRGHMVAGNPGGPPEKNVRSRPPRSRETLAQEISGALGPAVGSICGATLLGHLAGEGTSCCW